MSQMFARRAAVMAAAIFLLPAAAALTAPAPAAAPAEAVGSLDGKSFGPASIAEVRTATGTLMCGGKGELFEIVYLTPENWGFGEMPTEP
jgi:hypothetical protein